MRTGVFRVTALALVGVSTLALAQVAASATEKSSSGSEVRISRPCAYLDPGESMKTPRLVWQRGLNPPVVSPLRPKDFREGSKCERN